MPERTQNDSNDVQHFVFHSTVLSARRILVEFHNIVVQTQKKTHAENIQGKRNMVFGLAACKSKRLSICKASSIYKMAPQIPSMGRLTVEAAVMAVDFMERLNDSISGRTNDSKWFLRRNGIDFWCC